MSGCSKSGLEFGTEMEVAVLHLVIERFDAKTVADEDKAVFIFAPKGGGEHATKA